VVSELRGEAIDIIPWHPDPARFVVYAIAPAQVSRVYIDDATNTMEVIVPDDQLAKAIGRRGQNVRLAAQLTGWRIDIFSESKHGEMLDTTRSEISRIAGIDEAMTEAMIRYGFQSAQEVADAPLAEVVEMLSVDEKTAQAVIDGADAVVEQLIMEEAAVRQQGSSVEE
jgi:N utilization substance protein A